MRIRSFTQLLAILAVPACRGDLTSPGEPALAPPAAPVAAAVADSVILIVAGDMHANCVNPSNRARATAAVVQAYPQALVVAMGDDAGQSSTRADFVCYGQSWGAFKDRTYAAIGNHELNLDTAGTPYFDYFNGVGVDSGRAGRRGRGYYTLSYGGWRIFVANNHRNMADQAVWMARDIASRPKRCTMAIWHRPLFSSSAEPVRLETPGQIPRWWQVLYDGGADLVVNGHAHNYERFARLRPDGVVDTARGIREFVVGTGGSGLFDFRSVPRAGSQKRIKTWGVLKLTLWPGRYKWQFLDVRGVVLDQGQARCS